MYVIEMPKTLNIKLTFLQYADVTGLLTPGRWIDDNGKKLDRNLESSIH